MSKNKGKSKKHLAYVTLFVCIVVAFAVSFIVSITLHVQSGTFRHVTVSAPPLTTKSYIVGPQGSGSSCVNQAPCAFYTGLGLAMQQGGTVVLLDGEYKNLDTNYSSASNQNTSNTLVTIMAQNVGKARLDFKSKGYYGLYLSGGSVKIEGIEITGNDLIGGLLVSKVENSTIQKVVVRDIATNQCSNGAGIYIEGRASDQKKYKAIINDVTMYNIGPSGSGCTKKSGLYSGVEQAQITNSLLSTIAGSCLVFDQESKKIALAHSALDHCSSDAIVVGSNSLTKENYVLKGSVVNTIIRDSGGACIKEKDNVGRVMYVANVCWNNAINNLVSLQRTVNKEKIDNALDSIFYYEDPIYKNYSDAISPVHSGADYSLADSSPYKNKAIETDITSSVNVSNKKSGTKDIGLLR